MRSYAWICTALLGLAMAGCGAQKGHKGPSKKAPAAKSPEPKAAPKRDEAKFALGLSVFREKSRPSCKSCHTLAAAGSRGAIGPDLDTLAKTEAEIIKAVTGGLGVMPAQAEVLSPQEIEAVAYYVVHARKVK